MTDITELAQSLKAAAEKAIPGRIGDRIDGSGSIKYQCFGNDGSLVLQTDHKNMEYGFIGPNAETDELFFRECAPDNILALVEALEKAQTINAAAEKLVRCKGRYHSEQNYRALAALLGVKTPDLPPLEHENVHYADAAEMEIAALRQRIAELESRTVTVKLPPKIERDDADGWFTYKGGRVGGGAAEWYNKALDDVGAALSAVVIVKPEDADGIREKGNQFLVVRHPGKVPVIKHPVGQLEDYLLQILKADPLATIDIVTHRYYGVGGQFVEDADEYLHEMGNQVGG